MLPTDSPVSVLFSPALLCFAEDEVTEEGYTRFLVSSPLRPRPKTAAERAARAATAGDSPSSAGASDKPKPKPKPKRTFPYGTYHQCHRVDGELVAVGVLDLLPSGLSSVYAFFDPERRDLVLGGCHLCFPCFVKGGAVSYYCNMFVLLQAKYVP